MLFEAYASSFWAMAGVLCVGIYAEFALLVYGWKLYRQHGQELIVYEGFDPCGEWSAAADAGRYWDRRLLKVFALGLALAGGVWHLGAMGAVEEAASGDRVGWLTGAQLLGVRDGFAAAILWVVVTLVTLRLRGVIIRRSYNRSELLSGRVRVRQPYAVGTTAVAALGSAPPLLAIAVLHTTPVTVGFAVAPFMALGVLCLAALRCTAAEASPQAPAEGDRDYD